MSTGLVCLTVFDVITPVVVQDIGMHSPLWVVLDIVQRVIGCFAYFGNPANVLGEHVNRGTVVNLLAICCEGS